MIFIAAALFCTAASVQATEWDVYGARARGMGGAGVALAQGAVGSYWNPAGLGQDENPSGLQIPVGLHAEISGPLLQGAKDFNQIQQDCKTLQQHGGSGPVGTCTQANLTSALSNLSASNSGLQVDAGAGVDLKFGRLALFANDLTYLAATAFVDSVHTTPTTVSNNTSALILHGISGVELGLGYGHELPFVDGVLVGGNIKMIAAKAGYARQILANNDPTSSDSLNSFKDNTRETIRPAVDLGILWDIDRTFGAVPLRPRLGITARNINNPKFNEPDIAKINGEPSRIAMEGNVRAGLALSPFHFWTIAADADLTKNHTLITGVASQNIGVGTEINIFNRSWLNIPLRAGVSKNAAQSDSRAAISAGAGFNFLHFNVDASVASSPSNQTVQSQGKTTKFPANVAAAVQVGFLFGGGTHTAKSRVIKPVPVSPPTTPAAPAPAEPPAPALPGVPAQQPNAINTPTTSPAQDTVPAPAGEEPKP